MSTVDKNVILEALFALSGTTHGGKETGSDNELNLAQIFINLKQYTFKEQSLRDFAAGSLDKLPVGIEEKFLDPKFNRDFTDTTVSTDCERGGEPYKRPLGWQRFALKVLDKYPDGNTWLGTNRVRTADISGLNRHMFQFRAANFGTSLRQTGPVVFCKLESHHVSGEWPVSYHGTSMGGVKGITESHYTAGPRKMYGKGIYSTPDISVASAFSTEFHSDGKTYRALFQNRINPQMRKICDDKDYWLIEIPEGISPAEEKKIVEKSIRPYGILLKEVK